MFDVLAFAGAALICAVLFINTARFSSRQIRSEPASQIALDKNEIALHLSKAVTFKTISYQEPSRVESTEFSRFHAYLKKTFPHVHSTLKKEIVGKHSLLYTWKGRDEKLKPILLMAHIDVVPVDTKTEEKWKHAPFGGDIADGFIWGRGTMDFKVGVMGILEAVEILLKEQFVTERTIYIAFGHDEEVGGQNGAANIAAMLRSRGVTLEYIFDEGGFIAADAVPFISAPIALVGTAEKGYVSVELTTESEGGHASMPPKQTAIGVLSAAIHRLEKNQMPARLDAAKELLYYVGPEAAITQKIALANLWLFGPSVKRALAASPSTNALIRTTAAITIIEGGVKENVLPNKARAVVNVRILQGDRVDDVLAHIKNTIADERVTVSILYDTSPHEPSDYAPATSPNFIRVHRTIKQIFPDAIVAPYVLPGATDTSHYKDLSENIYRFVPILVDADSSEKPHSIDERVGVDNYAQIVRFYSQLILNSQR